MALTCETSHDFCDDVIQILVLWRLVFQLVDTYLIQRFVLGRSVKQWVDEDQRTSIQHVMSEFSTRLFVDKMVLYGSTTVSDTLGEGKMEKVASIRSGYSSRILPKSSDPRPEPVPPPRAAKSIIQPTLRAC